MVSNQFVKFRFEKKYMMNAMQTELNLQRMNTVMKLDPHVGEQGFYRIRSLYFDDIFDSCYQDNIAGVDPREKFRIRLYNGNPDRIRLEIKRKECGKIRKTSCKLTKELAAKMMNGERISIEEATGPVLRKFYIKQEERLLQPKVIVEYDRIPYICEDGNVRITFDYNVASSSRFDTFLDKEIITRPVMEAGQTLLEVKYDGFLPDPIKNSLQLKNISQTSYSKYCQCRRYNL